MTSRYEKCWLQHCFNGTERKVKDKSQAHCSERESLMPVFLESRSFRETWCDVSMSRCVSDLQTRQVLGNHFLMETRIICLIKQDLYELMRQENQVGSLDNCIEELQQQAYAQRLELEDAQHGNIESRQEQAEWTTTEKVLRKTQIRNVHEMDQRRELKNYEWKNSPYTIERRSWNNTEAHFTNTINARANEFWIIQVNFKKWNHISVEDCLTFPVNQQCHLTHEIRLDNKKTFLVINFLQLTPEIVTKEFTIFLHQVVQDTPSTTWLFLQATGMSQDMKILIKQRHNSNADICRKAVDHELSTVDIPQNSMVGQQRQQTSKLQFFRTPQSFFMLEYEIQKPSDYLFWFCIGNYVWDQRSEDGLPMGRIEISAKSLLKGFSKLRDAGREDCFCSEEDHPEFTFQDESQPRGAESPEKGPFSTRKLDAMFPRHDVFRFADQASVGKSLLDGNKDHLLYQARSERFCETRTSMIGIAGRTTRKCWISKRTISPARRIIDEGKGRFSEILKSEVQEKIMRHHKNSLLGCKKTRTDEFSSAAILAPELSRSK